MRTRKTEETETPTAELGEETVKDTAADIREVLEADAAGAKPAPDMNVTIDDPRAYGQLPLKLEQWYDEKYPTKKHVWRDGLITERQLKSERVEVVKGPDGEVIRYGQGDGMVLVSFDRSRFDSARKREGEQSEEGMAGLVREGLMEAQFMQTASPKKPIKKSSQVGKTG